MPDLEVEARLQVEEGGAERPLRKSDLEHSDPAAGPGALEETQALIEAALGAVRALLEAGIGVTVSNPTADPETGLAKEQTLELVRQLLAGTLSVDADVSDRPARELGRVTLLNPMADPETGLAKDATLQQVRDKDFATAAKQDVAKAVLDAILASVDGLEGKDYATQTTLADILAKLIAAPATEAKQDTLIGHVDGIESGLSTRQPRRDDYSDDEHLDDQTQGGSAGVLTFSFSADVNMAIVRADGGTCRAASSETPTATKGFVCADDEPAYIPLNTDELKVYAPATVTVKVSGLRY